MFKIKKSSLINNNTINKSRYETWYNYYSNDPRIFLENILGIELKPHQKVVIKLLTKINRIKDRRLIKKDIIKCPVCGSIIHSRYLFKRNFGLIKESYSCNKCGYSHEESYGYCKEIIDGMEFECYNNDMFFPSDDFVISRDAAFENLSKKYRK